jgi:cytoskeletal protein CcmA (bactofilin family)
MRLKKESPDEIVSIIGEGVEVSGEISSTRGLRVDGAVKGKLNSAAMLQIGPQGRVEGEAVVRKVSVSGELRGVVHASDRVEIRKEGKVYGDVFTPCLIIEAGAVFEGKCNMSEQKIEKGDSMPQAPRANDTPPI